MTFDDFEHDLVATAFHEAGHAVMAISLGRQIQKATIEPAHLTSDSIRLGSVKFQPGRSKATQDWLEDEVLIMLAGMVAEAFFTGEYCEQSASHDLRAVARLLEQRAATQRRFEKIHRRMLEKTEHVLGDAAHRQAVEAVASELLEKSSVSGRLVRHHLNQAIAQNK